MGPSLILHHKLAFVRKLIQGILVQVLDILTTVKYSDSHQKFDPFKQFCDLRNSCNQEFHIQDFFLFCSFQLKSMNNQRKHLHFKIPKILR